MKDKVETLEEILTRYSGGPGRNDLHLMNGPTFQNMLRQEDGILQYIPAVKELQEENAAIQGSVKRARELIGEARFKTDRYRATDIDGTLCCANAILSLTTTTGLDRYVREACEEKDKRIATLEATNAEELNRRAKACLSACDGVELEWLEGGLPGCVQGLREDRGTWMKRAWVSEGEAIQLRATNAAQAERIGELEDTLRPMAECHLPPAGCEHLGVTAHFKTEQIAAAKSALLQSSTPVESQLAGGEVAGYFQRDHFGDYKQVDESFKDDEDVFPLYTAPAIKQQVAEEVKDLMKVYDYLSESTEHAHEDGTVRCGTDAMRDVLQVIDQVIAASVAPTHPVSANQPAISGTVPTFEQEQAFLEAATYRVEYGEDVVLENLSQCLQAMLAAPSAPIVEQDGWQPIETAPNDGMNVLVCSPDWENAVIGYCDDDGWNNPQGKRFWYQPTLWHPIPAPPTIASPSAQIAEGGE